MKTKIYAPCTNMITRFIGEYSFLSNFYIEPDGSHVEGEFQASKNPDDAPRFAGLTPTGAKYLGRRVNLRKDWEHVKYQIMHNLVLTKFQDHPELRQQLLDTHNLYLLEGNVWNDQTWGMTWKVQGGGLAYYHGYNYLGLILMSVRKQLS